MDYAVHYQHETNEDLQFIDGYDEENLVPQKKLWKKRGYTAKRVYILNRY